MTHDEWLDRISGGAAPNAIAQRAGYPASTLTRQLKRGALSAEVVIQISRAYKTSVLEGMVACGIITAREAEIKESLGIEEALKGATDAQLLTELLRRVDEDGALAHPEVVQPLDDHHPAMRVYGYGEDIDVDADDYATPYAANDPGTDPDEEAFGMAETP